MASAGIPVSVITYILLDLDKAESPVAKFAKLFSYVSMRAERRAVVADIQSKIKACQKDNTTWCGP